MKRNLSFETPGMSQKENLKVGFKVLLNSGKTIKHLFTGFVCTLILLVFFGADPALSQIKIYVNTDLEGISGVYKFAQTREKDTPLNIEACEYFMADLAAVIRGLRDGGATEIFVLDGHGNQAIIPHLMIPGAVYATGRPKDAPGGLWGLDDSYDGMVLLGFHAMNGTPDGVLCHTQSSRTENKYWYNGVESGEIVQSSIIAGYYGVPPIMVTGDEATCREARKFFGNELVTVATKIGISREAAVLYPFDETRKALYEGAKKAVAAIPRCKPYKIDLPIKAKKEYLDLDPKLPQPKLITKEAVIHEVLKLLDL
jgi:D-amino peptidase